MVEYRIVKIESKWANGDSHVVYRIEKSFFGWWLNAKIKQGYLLGKLHGGMSDIMIRDDSYTFHKLEDAQRVLNEHLINPYEEYYKGSQIIKIIWDCNGKDVYVNKSFRTGYYAGNSCYEYSSSLDYLKSKIDRRIGVVTKTVV